MADFVGGGLTTRTGADRSAATNGREAERRPQLCLRATGKQLSLQSQQSLQPMMLRTSSDDARSAEKIAFGVPPKIYVKHVVLMPHVIS